MGGKKSKKCVNIFGVHPNKAVWGNFKQPQDYCFTELHPHLVEGQYICESCRKKFYKIRLERRKAGDAAKPIEDYIKYPIQKTFKYFVRKQVIDDEKNEGMDVEVIEDDYCSDTQDEKECDDEDFKPDAGEMRTYALEKLNELLHVCDMSSVKTIDINSSKKIDSIFKNLSDCFKGFNQKNQNAGQTNEESSTPVDDEDLDKRSS